MEHGHPSPNFLRSRFLEVENLVESKDSEGYDTGSELENNEASDEEAHTTDETTGPESSP
jgi:hypothetical protein